MKHRTVISILFALISLSLHVRAQEVTGTVKDSLGAVVPQAHVELLDTRAEAATSADADKGGHYKLTVTHPSRYRVRASASGFSMATSQDFYAAPDRSLEVNLTLFLPAVAEKVVVTATGSPLPEPETGASVSVLDRTQLDFKQNLQDALRVLPGIQVAQVGQMGGATSLFVRGGGSDDNKVLIDGVPVNDLGGSVDFSNITTTGLDRVEVLRGPNSALFGADAMASVVDIRTRRGSDTPFPQFDYSAEGGNFGTLRQSTDFGGAWRKFDYFSSFTRFDTRNSEPNSQFHNGTYAGNFGWNLLPNTEIRTTVRRSVSNYNAPNALDLYGLPDDAQNRASATFISTTLESKTTSRWHNLLRYGAARQNSFSGEVEPGAGIAATDPYGGTYYLGLPVTLTGANGYTASGQAVLSSGAYTSSNLTNRDFVYAQSDYTWNRHLSALGGFRYEDERGYTYTNSSYGQSKSSKERGNYSYLMQIQGSFWERAYYTLGSSIEDNAVFGVEGTPRASLAYYAVRPRSEGKLAGTRLKFNFAKGVKEPSIYAETNSLYDLLKSQPNGNALIQQYGIRPVGAQRSRSYDGGIDQYFCGGRGRLGVTYYHNEFGDELEYVPGYFLPQLGISTTVANTISGAYINTLSYSAQGVETELEYRWRRWHVSGGWTYLDAKVQHSFASSALSPAYNPSIPGVPIGAYSPLVGARPFRRAPHTGYATLDWSNRRWVLSVSGTFVGSRDDSTYATDANYGNSLLLPNRNLLGGYQRVDGGVSYRVNPVLTLTASVQNLLSQHYEEAFGYPSLPLTFRTGVRFTLGGESWHGKL